jgi:hypothetical protein
MNSKSYKNNTLLALTETLKDLSTNGFDCYVPLGLVYASRIIATREADGKVFKIKIKYVDKVNNELVLRLQSKLFSLVGRRSQLFKDVDGIAIFNKELQRPIYVHKDQVELSDSVYSILLDDTNSPIEEVNIDNW